MSIRCGIMRFHPGSGHIERQTFPSMAALCTYIIDLARTGEYSAVAINDYPHDLGNRGLKRLADMIRDHQAHEEPRHPVSLSVDRQFEGLLMLRPYGRH